MRSDRWKSLMLASSLVLLSGPPFPARADSGDLQPLIDQLNSTSLADRDAATLELRRALAECPGDINDKTKPVVEYIFAAALRDPFIALEQRVRLGELLRERFFRTPRAAVGVEFAALGEPKPGVILGRVVPGFPAHDQGILRARDMIIKVNGVELSDASGPRTRTSQRLLVPQERLRRIVISHNPGDVVRMTVVRPLQPPPVPVDGLQPPRLEPEAPPPPMPRYIVDGPQRDSQVVEVTVPLGSFSVLNAGPLHHDILLEAWHERLDRLGVFVSAPPVLPEVVEADPPRQILHRRAQVTRRGLHPAENQVGAVEDLPIFDAESVAIAQAAPAPVLRIPPQPRIARQKNAPDAQVRFQLPADVKLDNRAADQIVPLLQRVGTLEEQLRRQRAESSNDKLDAQTRAAAEDRAELIEQAINDLNQEIRAIIESAAKKKQP